MPVRRDEGGQRSVEPTALPASVADLPSPFRSLRSTPA